jgi:hypothetical protein
MALQPGVGYTFTTSSQGENINIIQPWSDLIPIVRSSPPQQFEVRQYSGVSIDTAAIQIAKGAVNFDQSNMPEVWESPSTSRRQIYMQKVAVITGDVTATDGGVPVGETPWLDNGGYYTLPGDGFYYVTISKMDIDGTLEAGGVSDSPLIQTNRPFISIFKSSNSLYSKIFQQTGPSLYVNKTNIEPMGGYDAESTGLDYDFGACHTTWFNPVKYGYDCKIIATIEVTTETVDDDPVKKLDIRQHVVGSIGMNIPLQYLGSTLFDKEAQLEEDDPYNVNEEDGFLSIVNSSLRTSLDTITARTTTFFTDMIGPEDWEPSNYLFADECTGPDCAHPFHVRKVVTGETVTFKVCTGMVNNIIPSNMNITIGSGGAYVYVNCTVAGENYPDGVTIGTGASIPADTDSNSYIAIAHIVDEESEQLVSSSLWTERFKCGETPAKYWWSNV